jgi:hypothetical protein
MPRRSSKARKNMAQMGSVFDRTKVCGRTHRVLKTSTSYLKQAYAYSRTVPLCSSKHCRPGWLLSSYDDALIEKASLITPAMPARFHLDVRAWPARQPISQKSVSSRVASLKIAISSASRAGVA